MTVSTYIAISLVQILALALSTTSYTTVDPLAHYDLSHYGDYSFEDYEDYEDEIIAPLGKEELNIPSFSSVPMALSVVEIGEFDTKYGTYIGEFNAHSHGIRGHVYIVDQHHLFIRKFSYDGGGTLDAYFWVGQDKQPSPKGQVVPFPPHGEGIHPVTKKPLPLPKKNGQNVLLPLPVYRRQGYIKGTEMDVSEVKWLSIWCTRFTVNFAEIFLPVDPLVPRRMILERFSQEYSRLRSDIVQIVDAKMFYIPNLQLHVGHNNGYKFKASLRTNPRDFSINVPNENNRYDDLRDYDGRDIKVTLPGKTTVYDIAYLAIVDTVRLEGNRPRVLGQVRIPSAMELQSHPIPPCLQQNKPYWPQVGPDSEFTSRRPTSVVRGGGYGRVYSTEPPPTKKWKLNNCREFLGRKIRLMWSKLDGVDEDKLYFRMQAKTDEDEYAALGIVAPQGDDIPGLREKSGMESRKTVDVDMVKIFLNRSMQSSSSTPQGFTAIDTFMSQRKRCTLQDGLCLDGLHGGYNDVILVDGSRQAGTSTVDFIRPFAKNDNHDVEINRSGFTQIQVAIGSLLTPAYARRENSFNMENGTIDFNSDITETCLEAVPQEPDPIYTWKVPFKLKHTRHFDVLLGPPGGSKGYKAITGEDIPFVELCWWINGYILPELTVYRGETYYFKVNGGDNEQDSGSYNYHPFYITSDRRGGFQKKMNRNNYKETERVWAGVENPYNYNARPTAVGPFCHLRTKEGEDKWRESETFLEYKTSLQKVCEETNNQYGQQARSVKYGFLNWTVAKDTDSVVYYQSYTHEGLGWKIRVRDPGERNFSPSWRSWPVNLWPTIILSLTHCIRH